MCPYVVGLGYTSVGVRACTRVRARVHVYVGVRVHTDAHVYVCA